MGAPYMDPSIYAQMELREGDVFVSTGGKQGTTWSCYIVQQLLSNGFNDFESLLEIAPWAEFVYYPGQPMEERLKILSDMPRDKRRSFKTHIPPPALPLDPRVKYVVCVRNPLDTMTSFFPFINKHHDKFRELWGNFPPKMPSWEIYAEFIKNFDIYWGFTNGWWPHRHEKNVFVMHFCDLKNQLEDTLRRLAKFLDVEASDALIHLVSERADFKNMKINEEKFESLLSGKNRDIPCLEHGAMIRKGEVNNGNEAPQFLKEMFLEKCNSSCLDQQQLAWCMNGGKMP